MSTSPRLTTFCPAVLLALALGTFSAGAATADSSGEVDATGITVKVDRSGGGRIEDVIAGLPLRLDSAVLASHDIYLVQPTTDAVAGDRAATELLAQEVAQRDHVNYAEANAGISITDQRGYRAWPDGGSITSDGGAAWRGQRLAEELTLSTAHWMTRGDGVAIAVLDTGADIDHPALRGKTVAGYDYIGDDQDPAEERSGVDNDGNGVDDQAFGHGTFVSSVALLVAPGARIMPMRVLDSDGVGDAFVLAAAITDAVDAGADVINLSLGTADDDRSVVLAEALKYAADHGVAVVAAAGNEGTEASTYPASESSVVGVGSATPNESPISPYFPYAVTSAFSNYGNTVDMVALAEDVVGALPGEGYAVWSGTSMAAPVVAGQLALVMAVGNGTSAQAALYAITESAYPVRGDHGVKSGGINLIGSILQTRYPVYSS